MDLHLKENQKNLVPPLAIVCVAAALVWISPVVALLVTCVSLAVFAVWALSRTLLLNQTRGSVNANVSPANKEGRVNRSTAGTREGRTVQDIKEDAEQTRILQVAWLPFVLLLGMIPVFLVVYFISQ